MADCNITHDGGRCGCEHAGCDGGHEHGHEHAPGSTSARPRRFGWWGAGGRFFGWWLGMSGLVGMFAVCPCCGTQACPNGIVGMGFVGAVMASFMRVRRWLGGSRAAGS